MNLYNVEFRMESVRISPQGGSEKKTIESKCNQIIFECGILDAPGSVPGTGLEWDRLMKELRPRVNGVPLVPYIVGNGGFSRPIAERQVNRNPQRLIFEAPSERGIITTRFVLEVNPTVGFIYPIDFFVTRRFITFPPPIK